MMKKFLDDSFLLDNKTSEFLYNSFARDLPIIDYHSHINPEYLAENKHFGNLATLWITGDPYKHRAMRINGLSEQGITGDEPDKIKYLNWVKTFPNTFGNPLFHWSCLELKRVFGIDEILSEQNSEEIWNFCNARLAEDGFGAMDILLKWKAEVVCTSDDLTNDLKYHETINKKGNELKVLPSLRSDSIISFDTGTFSSWLQKLCLQCNTTINNLDDYKEAIIKKLDHFNNTGCRLSDQSLDSGFTFLHTSESEANTCFKSLLNGKMVHNNELVALKSHLLVFLGEEYNRRGWTMELHIGAHRYTSTRLRTLAGPNGGYSAIGNACDIHSLCSLLDTLEKNGNLPRTILFTLNPVDNEAFASITGSFSEDGIAGKIQFGPAWWYNDHYYGIQQQLMALSGYGLLSRFIGMTTDSRSILSFSRHEYFRRILCNMLGEWIEKGHFPNDVRLLEQIIKDISYNNSRNMLFNN